MNGLPPEISVIDLLEVHLLSPKKYVFCLLKTSTNSQFSPDDLICGGVFVFYPPRTTRDAFKLIGPFGLI